MDKDHDILAKFGDKQPFSVPDNYFENFAADIEHKIALQREDRATTRKVVPMIQKLKPYIYAAAMFACVWVLGNFMLDKTANTGNGVAIASEEQQEGILDNQEQTDLLLAYVDEYTLIEYLAEHPTND